ncbi:MAG: hypothetical protein WBC85_14405 [Planktotalea sp.]|uniref:hypothetical protein n=1 Tax=Planktotalea sp. TaxID=2029877 RepID=UPI003C729AB5
MGDNRRLASELEALLEREYAALLAGDLLSFEQLIAQKVSLLEALGALSVAELTSLAPLRTRLHRNQRLAESAIKGMRSAITRAKDIRHVSQSLSTYNEAGQSSLVKMQPSSSLSKRS